MLEIKNKPLVILVIINIVALMTIFWLIGLLMGRNSAHEVGQGALIQEQEVVVQEQVKDMEGPAPSSEPAHQSVADAGYPDTAATRSVVPPGESIEQVVGEVVEHESRAEEEIIERTHTVDVFYDGSIVRLEESDGAGNISVLISDSIEDIEKLNPEDVRYIAALSELKQELSRHVTLKNVSPEEAARYRPRKILAEPVIDRFNKVDVSTASALQVSNEVSTMAQQIAAIVAEKENVDAGSKEDSSYAQASLEDYVESLDTASVERANETRTIRVKRGDSLWRIAVRAYGSGFQYPRIYRANPHLTNPHLIREGELLRVPL